MLAHDLLAGLRHLDLSANKLETADVLALAKSSQLAGLCSLRLASERFDANSCGILALSPHLANLTTLSGLWLQPGVAGSGVSVQNLEPVDRPVNAP